MLLDPRHPLRTSIRRYLGIHLLHKQIRQQGELMATAAEQITALGTKIETLSGVTGDIAADFAAFRAAMEAGRENLSPTGQAALDDANAKADTAAAKLADLDVAVGDADGSDTPAEPGNPEGV